MSSEKQAMMELSPWSYTKDENQRDGSITNIFKTKRKERMIVDMSMIDLKKKRECSKMVGYKGLVASKQEQMVRNIQENKKKLYVLQQNIIPSLNQFKQEMVHFCYIFPSQHLQSIDRSKPLYRVARINSQIMQRNDRNDEDTDKRQYKKKMKDDWLSRKIYATDLVKRKTINRREQKERKMRTLLNENNVNVKKYKRLQKSIQKWNRSLHKKIFIKFSDQVFSRSKSLKQRCLALPKIQFVQIDKKLF